jgi:hypothetical protein
MSKNKTTELREQLYQALLFQAITTVNEANEGNEEISSGYLSACVSLLKQEPEAVIATVSENVKIRESLNRILSPHYRDA